MYSVDRDYINPSNPVIAGYFVTYSQLVKEIVLQNVSHTEYTDVTKCILLSLFDYYMTEKKIAHTSYEVGNFERAYRLFSTMMDHKQDAAIAYRLGMMHVVGKAVPVNAEIAQHASRAILSAELDQCNRGLKRLADLYALDLICLAGLIWYNRFPGLLSGPLICNLGLEAESPQELATHFFQLAAQKGSAIGYFSMGFYQDKTVGYHDLAAKYYLKAAEKHCPNSQCNLSWLYLKGRGVPQDTQRAMELLAFSANQGRPEAIFRLGKRFSKDKYGVTRDLDKSIAFLERTIALADENVKEPARQYLERVRRMKKDEESGVV